MTLVLSRDPHVHVAELKETAQVPGLIYETTQRQVIGCVPRLLPRDPVWPVAPANYINFQNNTTNHCRWEMTTNGTGIKIGTAWELVYLPMASELITQWE